MTDKASPTGISPDEPGASPKGNSSDEPGMGPDLARFFQDWTELWREELQAQAKDPETMPLGMLAGMIKGGMTSEIAAATETWRAAMVAWATTMGVTTMGANTVGASSLGADSLGAPPSSVAASREPAATPRTQAVAAASDAGDAEIERLARRVDELEARLAELEKPRRRRG